MTNKTNRAAKIIFLFIFSLVAIISSAALWNAAALGTVIIGTFELVMSIVNFILEGCVVVYLIKKLPKLE